ncbi:hypothetical protein IKE71_01190 [Candidatus Saccharibacteria bacterium]|nr:hypothetical protein [Candidatus Saccharibacteria bacterium]
MNPEPSRLKQFLRSPLTLLIAGILVFTALIAVFIIAFSRPKEESATAPAASSITVSNFSDFFPDLSGEFLDNLESRLLTQSLADSSFSSTTSAEISSDSFFSLKSNNYTTGDFLITLPSLNLTYLVSFQYGTFAGRSVESEAFATIYCTESSGSPCSAKTNYSRPTLEALTATEEAELTLTNL